MKSVIGITCNYDYRDAVGIASHMGAETQDWDFLASDYVRSVQEAGGIPVIIPNARIRRPFWMCQSGWTACL